MYPQLKFLVAMFLEIIHYTENLVDTRFTNTTKLKILTQKPQSRFFTYSYIFLTFSTQSNLPEEQ